jgi:hypothetical protein
MSGEKENERKGNKRKRKENKAAGNVGQILVPVVGDNPRGPLKQRGNPHLKPATKPKHSLPNHAGYGPRRRDPDGPSRRPS